MAMLIQDSGYAVRMLRKSPGFTAVVVLTLALGIGVNSAVFSIVNAVILRPLPYKDSSRLVSVDSKSAMFPDMSLNLTWPAFQRVRRQVSAFEQSTVYWEQSKVLTGLGEPQLLQIAAVSNQFFEQLGARPLLGRLLGDADQDERNRRIIVLSETLWRTHFGGDRDIVGRALTLDGKSYQVAGIAARGLAFPEKTEAWIPLEVTAESRENPTFYAFRFVGKLKSGVSIKELNAQLKVVSSQMEKEYPKLKDGYELVAAKLKETEVGNACLAFYVLFGASTLVLLIACTNLASMLLARSFTRQQEMAVRAALGASRRRIFQQMLAENCLLAMLGGGAGVGLAAVTMQVFRGVLPEDTPRLGEIHADWAMVAFAAGIALLTWILFGFAPARFATRAAIHKTLQAGLGPRGAGISAQQSKAGRFLVAAETALAFVLLIGAGLMLQTLQRLLTQNPGFRTENLLTFDLYKPELQSESDRKKDAPSEIAQTKEILRQVQRIPGVESVAAVSYGLLAGNVLVHGGLRVERSNITDPHSGLAVAVRHVSPTYFNTLGLALLRGRGFSDNDTLGTASVTIVNERMAQKYWGTLDVLGKRFSISKDQKGIEEWSEIVGVVTNAREFFVKDEAGPEYYLPLYQGGARCGGVLVRTARKPEALAGVIRKQIWSAYPNLPVTHVMTARAIIEGSVGTEKLHAVLLAVFAGTGLLMALAGTYGVIAYAVERRTQEIGIRIALGASRKNVLLLVCRHAFLPGLVGIALGVPVVFLAKRAIESELYGVKATDPFTFGVAAVLMILSAVVACWVPARHASRVDPMVALRYE